MSKIKALSRINEGITLLEFVVTPKDLAAALRTATTRIGKLNDNEYTAKIKDGQQIGAALIAVEKHLDTLPDMKRVKFDSMKAFHEAFEACKATARSLMEQFRDLVSSSDMPEGSAATVGKVEVPATVVKTKEPISVNVTTFSLHFIASPQFQTAVNGKATMDAALATYLADVHGASFDRAEDYPALYKGLRRALNSFIPKPPKADKPKKEKKAKEPKAKNGTAPAKKKSA